MPVRRYFDAHTHFQNVLNSGTHALIDGFFESSENMSICNGLKPADWNIVSDISRRHSGKVIPFFGVHPWFAGTLENTWHGALKKYLTENPSGIGEIGLDRSIKEPEIEVQKKVFLMQLELSVELSLPVTIHCVRSWGMILDILKQFFPSGGTSFMIHSFSGSEEIMKELAGIGGYFSFSPYLTRMDAAGLNTTFQTVPLNRLLLETDFPHGKMKHGEEADIYKRMIINLYEFAAVHRGMDLDEFSEVIWNNGTVFTDRTVNR